LIPVSDSDEQLSSRQVLERMFELYAFCAEHAARHKQEIAFEIAPKNNRQYSGSQQFTEVLRQTQSFAEKIKYRSPGLRSLRRDPG